MGSSGMGNAEGNAEAGPERACECRGPGLQGEGGRAALRLDAESGARSPLETPALSHCESPVSAGGGDAVSTLSDAAGASTSRITSRLITSRGRSRWAASLPSAAAGARCAGWASAGAESVDGWSTALL